MVQNGCGGLDGCVRVLGNGCRGQRERDTHTHREREVGEHTAFLEELIDRAHLHLSELGEVDERGELGGDAGAREAGE